MELIYSIICDQAFLSIDRKVNIIGVFETINVGEFPVTHPKFTLVGSIKPSSNKFTFGTDIVGPDGKSILVEKQERDVNLPENKEHPHFNFIVDILNTTFSESGLYKVVILVDDKPIGVLPLTVAQTEVFDHSHN